MLQEPLQYNVVIIDVYDFVSAKINGVFMCRGYVPPTYTLTEVANKPN